MPIETRGGAVASEHERATDIGIHILKQGGSAIDAVIAVTLALNTSCSYNSDLGGGGFALVRTPNASYEGYNFRTTAPVS
jgi:gamma-glutamyltranspeptidase/glutathione hydrolase